MLGYYEGIVLPLCSMLKTFQRKLPHLWSLPNWEEAFVPHAGRNEIFAFIIVVYPCEESYELILTLIGRLVGFSFFQRIALNLYCYMNSRRTESHSYP